MLNAATTAAATSVAAFAARRADAAVPQARSSSSSLIPRIKAEAATRRASVTCDGARGRGRICAGADYQIDAPGFLRWVIIANALNHRRADTSAGVPARWHTPTVAPIVSHVMLGSRESSVLSDISRWTHFDWSSFGCAGGQHAAKPARTQQPAKPSSPHPACCSASRQAADPARSQTTSSRVPSTTLSVIAAAMLACVSLNSDSN